jgi:hypothetical protein
MSYDTGLKGPSGKKKDDWEIDYKTLTAQLKHKKVLTEEIWQERVNPLIPPDGIVEEDIEILQYLGTKKQKENSGKKEDVRVADIKQFKKARNELVYKESDFLTVSILPAKRKENAGLDKLKKKLKVTKQEKTSE